MSLVVGTCRRVRAANTDSLLCAIHQITIAIMGYVDSIVAGKQNASRYNYAISPNRELTALGIGAHVGHSKHLTAVSD